MKKLTITLMVTMLIMFMAIPLSAQFFMSTLSDARTIADDGVVVGGGVSVFDNLLGLGGSVRIGVMDGLEIGGRAGFVNIDAGNDDHTGITFGGDIKYQIMDMQYGDAVDLSFGGGIEYYNLAGDAALWMFGTNTIVSYPFIFEGGQVVSPLFRLNLRFDRISAGDASNTDFELGFGFGAMVEISKHFGFFGEFVFSGTRIIDEGFVGGVWFGM